MTDSAEQPRYLQLARVLKPHGIRGDLRIQVVTNFPERMIDLEKIYVGPAPESYRASKEGLKAYRVTKSHRDKNDQWLIHLRGIDSREAADTLREMQLFVALEDAVPLQTDEYYLFQLMGLDIYDATDNRLLGKLTDVLETGANDVYVVRGETFGEVLIPALDDTIQQVDLAAGTVVMRLPNGLLPEDSTTDTNEDYSRVWLSHPQLNLLHRLTPHARVRFPVPRAI
jgi:16S rRNA processing protein RimM